MKQLSFSIILLSMFALTGCLKDDDFGPKYGIRIDENKAVAFPQAAKSPVTVGITGQAAPLTVTGPLITLEGSSRPTTDVKVRLQYDSAAARRMGLVPLPAGSYTLSTLEPVIPAGKDTIGNLRLTVTNTHLLDPNIKYGVGFTIVGVDGGYKIAENMKTMVIGFTIKNKYDGVYRLQGYHNRSPYTFPYDVEIHLVTNGPNEVYFYWPEVRSIGHPIGVSATSTSWYGDAIAPSIVFDPVTNMVTDVYNLTPGTVITMFTGAGSRVSKWNPATRAITVDWNYANNPLRAFFDDLTYIGPRP
jgi:hypothetical protein